MTTENLPIVTAVTAVDLPDGTFIVEIGEAIYIPENDTSLLSTFQAREHGVIVNDVARRHGGEQNIIVDDITIPLETVKGLLSFKIREPSQNEVKNCPRITLTSDSQWEIGDFDNKQAMKTTTDINSSIKTEDLFPAGSVNIQLRNNVTHTHVLDNDLKAVQPKMGWMPLSTLAKTLEVTTQLAKNTLRLPMRRHIKSRFPQLNRNRLREIYSTDTIFSSVPAINTGNTCMQIFSAKKSKFCAGYGMKNRELWGSNFGNIYC